MEYYVGTYHPSGENGTALLVQQVAMKRTGILKFIRGQERREERLLAAVCTGENANYLTQQLNEWFYEEGVAASGDTEGLLRRTEQSLNRRLQKNLEEYEAYRLRRKETAELPQGLSGIYAVGNGILLFGYGAQRIYLCNQLFNHPHIRPITADWETEVLVLQQLQVEPGIGLLLGTESYCGSLTEEQLRECLSARELHTGEGISRRLRELGDRAEEQGAQNLGALLVCLQ